MRRIAAEAPHGEGVRVGYRRKANQFGDRMARFAQIPQNSSGLQLALPLHYPYQ